MADSDRGELEIEGMGKAPMTLTFRSSQVMLLEKRLGKDPVAYIAEGGGQTNFLAEAMFAGLSQVDRRMNPIRAAKMLDEYEGDRTDLVKRIFYAMAKGKKGEDGRRMLEALEMYFGAEDDGMGPTYGSGTQKKAAGSAATS